MMTIGWAVIDGHEIDVRTVSPTRRAAIVNWLVLSGKMMLAHFSDESIEMIWRDNRGSAQVSEVTIQSSKGETE